MNKFEIFLFEKGIPISEVATPFERVLMRIGLLTIPVGLLNYPIRAIWFSMLFTLSLLGLFEFVVQVIVGRSLFTTVSTPDLLLAIFSLLLFGPIAAYFSNKKAEKHRNILQVFLSEN